ncbi:MAG UNVERIFIED_CONTAM: hypothetical protein LVR29_11290, partial [Microcystis novacekii LVE1205-3]
MYRNLNSYRRPRNARFSVAGNHFNFCSYTLDKKRVFYNFSKILAIPRIGLIAVFCYQSLFFNFFNVLGFLEKLYPPEFFILCQSIEPNLQQYV